MDYLLDVMKNEGKANWYHNQNGGYQSYWKVGMGPSANINCQKCRIMVYPIYQVQLFQLISTFQQIWFILACPLFLLAEQVISRVDSMLNKGRFGKNHPGNVKLD